MVTWAEQFTDFRHRRLSEHEIRLHTGIQNAALWTEAAQKAAQVAGAIERKLKRSTWSLVKRFEWDLVVRRFIRDAHKRRLVPANGFEESTRDSVRRLLDKILISAIQLPRALNSLINGPPTRPRFWTFRATYFRALRRDLAPVLSSAKQALLLTCCELSNSQAYILLREHEVPVRTGSIVRNEGKLQIVSSDSGEPLLDASETLIIVERAMPKLEYLRDLKYEICRLLSPIGKIVIILSRANKIDANEELTSPKETVAAFLYPDFRLLEQKTEGRLGSSTWFF